jgi:hypothetical protein
MNRTDLLQASTDLHIDRISKWAFATQTTISSGCGGWNLP